MPHPNLAILYVDSPKESGAFYAKLLEREPKEVSPTFVLFVLDRGMTLGLWLRHTVEPKPAASAGGGELAFAVDTSDKVDALCKAWGAQGVTIVQRPTDSDFGRTFLALDPDGHRLRVFAPFGA